MANVVQSKISLEDFIFEMHQIPIRDLKLDQLKELFGKLDLSETLINEHITFANDSYSRNLICRTPRFDMLCLCWRPGQVTVIHDHAGSLNVTRVFDGQLTARLFRVSDKPAPGRAFVKVNEEDHLGKTDFSCVDYGQIHQLENTSKHDLVTVHVYARPLKDIHRYCPNTGEVDRVTLRYTLEDEFA